MIGIGLVDDHEIFRTSLKFFLLSSGLYRVDIEASNGSQFLNLLEKSKIKPEIILTDYQMPVMNGLELLKAIKSQYPEIKIVILSAFSHCHIIYKMFSTGADGIIIKNSPIDQFSAVISNSMKGIQLISDGSGTTQTFINYQNQNPICNKINLSVKQIAFLRLCAVPEHTYKMIADILNLSPKTIDRYRDDLFKKLNINSRTGLALYAINNGLIGP